MKDQIVKLIIMAAVFAGVVFYAAAYFVEERERAIVTSINEEITEQQATLINLAEVTDRDGIDETIEGIVVDCKASNRNRFDTLLSNLATLDSAELAELTNLFDACADFYAKRKALMVARMEREFEALRDLVDLLEIVDDAITVDSYRVQEWERLLGYEQRRSELYAEQVSIQEDIINAIKASGSPAAESLQAAVLAGQDVREELMVVDKQSDELRSSLMNL